MSLLSCRAALCASLAIGLVLGPVLGLALPGAALAQQKSEPKKSEPKKLETIRSGTVEFSPVDRRKGPTIAGDYLAMLQNVDAVGNDLQMRGSSGAPTMRIADVTISGTR